MASAASDETTNMVFDMGNDSLYELTCTPPLPASRKSRFTRPQQPSGSQRKASGTNVTAQSNSFVLPDMPNITQLVSGSRKDGITASTRQTKSRSRFISKSPPPAAQQYHPIENVPTPEEERAIYASLHTLKDRVDQLEMEKSEAYLRAGEYEREILSLRSQLAAAQRRPDSGFGSDEDAAASKTRSTAANARLQASNVRMPGSKTTKTMANHGPNRYQTSLQRQLDRSERKVSVSETAVKRITSEREELLKRIGLEIHNSNKLKAQNETFKGTHTQLQTENEDIKSKIAALRQQRRTQITLQAENDDLKAEVETLRRQSKSSQASQKLQDENKSLRAEVETLRRQSEEMRSLIAGHEENSAQRNTLEHNLGGKGLRRHPSGEVVDSELWNALNGSGVETTDGATEREKDRQGGQAEGSEMDDTMDISRSFAVGPIMSKKEASAAPPTAKALRRQGSNGIANNDDVDQLAARIAAEVEKHSDAASENSQLSSNDRIASHISNSKAQGVQTSREASAISNNDRIARRLSSATSRSAKSSVRQPSITRSDAALKAITAAQATEDSDKDSTTRLDFEMMAKGAAKDAGMPTDDDTILSEQDIVTFKALRIALEEQRRTHGSKNKASEARMHRMIQLLASKPKSKNLETMTGEDGSTGQFSITSMAEVDENSKAAAKSVRFDSPVVLSEHVITSRAQSDANDDSILGTASSNTSRRRRRAASLGDETSEFIIPDMHTTTVTAPDIDLTDATVRPAQEPSIALASVLQDLENEIDSLKSKLRYQQALYDSHEPAMANKARLRVKGRMEILISEIERRVKDVYRLADVRTGIE